MYNQDMDYRQCIYESSNRIHCRYDIDNRQDMAYNVDIMAYNVDIMAYHGSKYRYP